MTNTPHLTCRELTRFLADYLDGTLPPDRRAVFDRHLAVCPACVKYLRAYEQTIRVARSALAEHDGPAAGAFPEELVKAVLAARTRQA